jgi:hypothetical protein
MRKWKEPRLPVETIKHLALGIYKNEVFTTSHIEDWDQHLLASIFPSLGTLSEQEKQQLEVHPPSLVYAYSKDAMNGRTVNGHPVFGTACLVWRRDAELLAAHYKRITVAVDAAMHGQVRPEAKQISRLAHPTPSISPSQRLLSVKDFVAQLGVSLWTVRGWAYKGRVASVKLGARMMIPTTELDRLIGRICARHYPVIIRVVR